VVKSRFVAMFGRASALVAGVVVLCTALPAWACPSCTTRSGGGYLIPILLGSMILTPYVVTTVVMRIIRKAETERAREDEASATRNPSHVDPAAGTAPARA